MFSVEEISRTPFDDSKFTDNWRIVLADLDRLYAAAKERKIRVVLLIFPFTFQLANNTYKEPQRVLSQHAKSWDVDVIDFTEVFEKIVIHDGITSPLVKNELSSNDIRALYGDKLQRYFLDSDHYTVEGHKVVASILYDYVTRHYSF